MENYFFETIDNTDSKKLFVLIIYDIVDNKVRVKLAKYLSGYGNRVQKSAFEARLTQKKYDKLIKGIPKYCGKEDSVRIYRINGRSQVQSWGMKEVPIDDEDVIII